MTDLSPRLSRACELAAAVLAREVDKRRRLNPYFNPDEVWASVTVDAHIFVGTPLLYPGQGYYVDHRGDRMKA
jgi:hypothetical protein